VNRTPWQGNRLRACPMRRLLLATLLLLLLMPAAGAVAGDRPQDLLIDACRDEKVDGTYSQRTYRRALDQLPADSDQYTACRDVINRARIAALNNRNQSGGGGGGGTTGSGGGGGGTTGSGGGGNSPSSSSTSSGGGGGGSTGSRSASSDSAKPATPAEQKQVQRATQSGAAPVRIGGELVQPGAVGRLSNGSRDLPTPMIALLAALAALIAAAAGVAGWNRVLARRTR
jgi:hypothetical protein